ncbi:hypothetical protein [Paractinoplanes rishiriensis]|uniref:Uncharacterized protein n=1 Tax=Paractinoplanes rishiriensis TaxID=1050105 RepID=A0A919JSX1_9ACTN|nr:hypothetical protein [Actinoplanes rishiriensis]GIE94183.1 hypothetical protein Ari01nite_16480 [Actinoplanes rishiriensis]
MKLKFKPNRKQLIVVGIVALVALGLMANRPESDGGAASGGLDDAGRQACNDFADGYADAENKPQRLALADKVMTSSRRTDNDAIADAAMELGTKASTGGSAWRSSADAFTTACRDADWVAP